jgi:hypothetical protein
MRGGQPGGRLGGDSGHSARRECALGGQLLGQAPSFRGDPSRSLPFAARILAAADVFAALTEPRAYREAFTVDAAADLLMREADTEESIGTRARS